MDEVGDRVNENLLHDRKLLSANRIAKTEYVVIESR